MFSKTTMLSSIFTLLIVCTSVAQPDVSEGIETPSPGEEDVFDEADARFQTNDSQDDAPPRPTRVPLHPFGVELQPILSNFSSAAEQDVSDITMQVIDEYFKEQDQTLQYVLLDGLRQDSETAVASSRESDMTLVPLRESSVILYCAGGIASFNTFGESEPPSVSVLMQWVEEAVNQNLVPSFQDTPYENIVSATFRSKETQSPTVSPTLNVVVDGLTGEQPNDKMEKGPPWVMVGSVVGALVAAGIIALVLFFCCRRHHIQACLATTFKEEENEHASVNSSTDYSDDGQNNIQKGNRPTSAEGNSSSEEEKHVVDSESASYSSYSSPVAIDMRNSCEESMDPITLKSVGSSIFPIMETESFQCEIQPVIRKDMLNTSEAFSSDRSANNRISIINRQDDSDLQARDDGIVENVSTVSGVAFVFESSDEGEMVQLKTLSGKNAPNSPVVEMGKATE